MKTILTLLSLFMIGSYVMNIYKLTQCDFEKNYKCEVIHGVGLIHPGVSIATVWFETDNK